MSVVFSSFSRERRFEDLTRAVQHCDLCGRLCQRTRVLSPSNGNLHSRVLFIAEAPGRLGADRTGIPLFGDQTGMNFERLLGNIKWRREQVFITNAVLCNPRNELGTNGTPTLQELRNCSSYLDMTITLVDPAVVVTLGKVALASLSYLKPHGFELQNDVGQLRPWNGYLVMPLYHPGPRALIRRSSAKQTSDFVALANAVDPVGGLKKKATGSTRFRVPQSRLDPPTLTPEANVALTVIEFLGQLSYFKLTKMLYLIDLSARQELGHTLTGMTYIRQQDGPWAPSLTRAMNNLSDFEILWTTIGKLPNVRSGPSPRIRPQLDEREADLVLRAVKKYGSLSNTGIKIAAYRTKPMQYVLKAEAAGLSMLNKPVLSGNSTCDELDDTAPSSLTTARPDLVDSCPEHSDD